LAIVFGVLVCSMLKIFPSTLILIYGLLWGYILTKYALKTNRDLIEVLVYWILLALVIALDDILRVGLFFMPFYHSLKLFLIIVLVYPRIKLT
jgi:hypothetical protein